MLGSSSLRRARLGLGKYPNGLLSLRQRRKARGGTVEAMAVQPRLGAQHQLPAESSLVTLMSSLDSHQSSDSLTALPAAVLWDLDGTLVDTEPAWFAGETAMAAAHGVEWTEQDALNMVGMDLRDAAAYMRTRIEIGLSDAEIIGELGAGVTTFLETEIPWRPGAFELFHAIAEYGVPQALVTMSYRSIAQPVIDALDFAAIVTGDMVDYGKPHPEPYLRAAAALGAPAEKCLAIEDSPTGTTSANAAGCLVVAVPNVVNVAPADRRHIVPSLRDISFEHLKGLFQR